MCLSGTTFLLTYLPTYLLTYLELELGFRDTGWTILAVWGRITPICIRCTVPGVWLVFRALIYAFVALLHGCSEQYCTLYDDGLRLIFCQHCYTLRVFCRLLPCIIIALGLVNAIYEVRARCFFFQNFNDHIRSGRVGSSNDLIVKKSPDLKGHGSNRKCKKRFYFFIHGTFFYVFNILLTFCNVVIFTNVGKWHTHVIIKQQIKWSFLLLCKTI